MSSQSTSRWVKSIISAEWLKHNCKSIAAVKQAHAFLITSSLFNDNLYSSKLVSFLAISDSGDLDYAQKIFTQIRLPDSFIFNTVIRGCARSSKPYEAVSMYNFVKSLGLAPDNFTYPFLLAACGRLAAVGLGRRFHSEVLRKGFGFDVFVVNALVQFYGSCGVYECACKVFDESPVRDVVTWNVMLKTCLSCGFHGKAFRLFEEMTKLSDFKPDDVTIVSLVSACSKLGDLVIGKQIHCYTEINGLDVNLNVGNAILDMYCKCGEVEVGEHLFSKMRKRDVLTCTSLLAGLANSGQFQKCLKLFQYLQSERIKPDEIMLVSVLSACAQTGALDQGKYIHLLIDRERVKWDVMLETALVDMYAKCGEIGLAQQVFHNMRVRNIFTWNAMIGGLAMHGHGQDAILLYRHIHLDTVIADDVTFIALLCACSHVGLVEDGLILFQEMKDVYKIEPRMEHYGCMVDLLCRARLVKDALAFIEDMPIKANSILWATLLGACRISGHFDLAEKAGKQMLELEPDSCGRYVMLSNLYANVRQWDTASSMRRQMKTKGIKKTPGLSWIELNGTTHQFIASDKSHSSIDNIYAMAYEMMHRVKSEGAHKPGISDVLLDVEEEEKENALSLHSEKLAVAFGIMSTPPGSTIRIVKNLRVCVDCHSFLKDVSKIYTREIIARDRNRFHHFREGVCSCMDFW
ncbi:unnamed protein product [Rhodiola kirilowii]